MFIWLASYPKSGNTLLRSLLAAYFFSQDGKFNFNLIKNIKQFPNIDLFEKYGVDIKNEDEVIKNYITVQQKINKKNSIQFLKTHSYLFNINNNSFTDLNNSLGVIYIVRDPRNLVTSLSNHSSITIDEAVDFLTKKIKWHGNSLNKGLDGEKTTIFVGTWGSNFKSWQSFNYQGRYLLIKYEDLINEKEKIFLDVLKFIHKLNKSKFILDKNRFNNSLNSTDFKIMQNLEKSSGFHESKIDPKTGKKIPFFYLGKKNNWKELLQPKIRYRLEEAFKNEMEELRYL